MSDIVSTKSNARMGSAGPGHDRADTTVDDATADTETYDDAFWRLIHLAHQRAFRVLGIAADAEDVAAETLARASLRWKRLRHPADAWVATVATRLAIDRQRSVWRNLPIVDDRLDSLPLTNLDGTPDGDRVDAAMRLDLARALTNLPKRQRQVLGLSYLSGYTEAEIAELLGCSASSVQTHKKRGLERLRSTLGASTAAPTAGRVSPGPHMSDRSTPDEEVAR